MDADDGMSHWAAAAVQHVTGRCRPGPLDRSLRVTLNFHPDRLLDGRTVLRRLADEGVYRSQFETGTSNGGLTAVCAWVYLIARALYVPAYALGWSPWRSLIFGAGFLATMVMILVALL